MDSENKEMKASTDTKRLIDGLTKLIDVLGENEQSSDVLVLIQKAVELLDTEVSALERIRKVVVSRLTYAVLEGADSDGIINVSDLRSILQSERLIIDTSWIKR